MQSANEIISLIPSTLPQIHPALSRERSSKPFEKWEYLLLPIIGIIDIIPASRICAIQVEVKRILTESTVHTHAHATHMHTIINMQ